MVSHIYILQLFTSLEELQEHDRDEHEEIPIVTLVITVG